MDKHSEIQILASRTELAKKLKTIYELFCWCSCSISIRSSHRKRIGHVITPNSNKIAAIEMNFLRTIRIFTPARRSGHARFHYHWMHLTLNFSFHFIRVNRNSNRKMFLEILFDKQRRQKNTVTLQDERKQQNDKCYRCSRATESENIERDTHLRRNGSEERNRLVDSMRTHEPNTKLFQSRLNRTNVLCSLAGHMFAGAHTTPLSAQLLTSQSNAKYTQVYLK